MGIVPSPNQAGDNALAAISVRSSSDAWAVGYYKPESAGFLTLILHWDGSTWSVVPSPAPVHT